MKEVGLREIGIDPAGRLYLEPSQAEFPFIRRAAKGVDWDESTGRLVSPRPIELSYPDWFELIATAVAEEYGALLIPSSATVWTGVPSDVRLQIEVQAARRPG